MGESLSFQTHPIRDVDERKAPCGTARAVRWTAAKRRLDGVCSIMSRGPSGVQKIPPGWREAIDKAPEMGYSKDTKGAASRTAPVCYREVTVTFGRVDMTPKCWTENPTFGGHIMSKISNEIRLEAVQRVVEDGMSISASARLAGVHKSMLQEWVMQYREHGAEGVIKQDRKQKKYIGEFKIEVVEYAHTNHLSAGAASAHFGLSTKSLFLKWERIYYEEGPQALLEERRGRASKMGKNVGRKKKLPDQTKEDLIAEVQRLRMENEYLKKLHALVQKRIARENGNGSKSSMN